MKNKLTVTIGTTAYNEEQSIEKMLKSVCRQKEKEFEIKEILVISDGSTDRTVECIKSIRDPRIVIIDDKKRLGPPTRIQELFRRFKGDYLVLLDADMVMEDKRVIQRLIARIVSDNKIALIAAHMHPLRPKTFLESAINNYRYARENLEKKFSFGNSVWGAHGCLVYSKRFAKELEIPKDVINVDTYSYFSCLSKKLKFAYVNDAVVYYRSPQTVRDFINQSVRYLVGAEINHKYFNLNFIKSVKTIPFGINLRLMLSQIFKNPLGYIILKFLNIYIAYKYKGKVNNFEMRWESINTSKNLD